MSITYIQGDLFTSIPTERTKRLVIPHVCNNFYVMGAGFVVPLVEKWPVVKERYVYARPPMGNTQFVQVNNYINEPEIYVANMIAQDGVGKNKKPLRYTSLIRCMDQVASFCSGHPTEIYAPKFGSGLAGGNWDFIEGLIDEIWADIPVRIFSK